MSDVRDILAACETAIRINARKVARRCRQSGLSAADLAQEARAAVVAAAERYDGVHAPKTFLVPRIVGAMYDAVRSASFAPRSAVDRGDRIPTVESVEDINRQMAARWRGESGVTKFPLQPRRFDPPQPDVETTADPSDFADTVRAVCGVMSDREMEILECVYVLGLSIRETARRMKMHPSHVSVAHAEILADARERAANIKRRT